MWKTPLVNEGVCQMRASWQADGLCILGVMCLTKNIHCNTGGSECSEWRHNDWGIEGWPHRAFGRSYGGRAADSAAYKAARAQGEVAALLLPLPSTVLTIYVYCKCISLQQHCQLEIWHVLSMAVWCQPMHDKLQPADVKAPFNTIASCLASLLGGILIDPDGISSGRTEHPMRQHHASQASCVLS